MYWISKTSIGNMFVDIIIFPLTLLYIIMLTIDIICHEFLNCENMETEMLI
jgi:hypothetical protein